jgi:predicted TIM-barrel fold metal-dependent hydrolase
MNRRNWMTAASGALAAGLTAGFTDEQQTALAQQRTGSAAGGELPLDQYQPKSMLTIDGTRVPRARFPVIDFHTHMTGGNGLTGNGGVKFFLQPNDCLAVMDQKNIRALVDLTGGYGDGLREAIAKTQHAHPGRFIVFTEPAYSKAADAGYPKFQADLLKASHDAGAGGLKVLKTLGLYLRDHVTTGKLIKIDDPRFDPMWETAGGLQMPVAIHSSDPRAFFLPIDRFNERWEELHAHPDWSFYGKDFPSNMELQEARRRVMRRHPRTQFVCLHMADSEDLRYVSECMDAHANMHVEMAARIGELGRQPRTAKKFIEKYQDRVMFGTDASPGTSGTPQQTFGNELYEIYFRFLESEDEYFDYAPAPIPPQGRWKIYGLGLSEPVLKKIYWENAARMLRLTA